MPTTGVVAKSPRDEAIQPWLMAFRIAALVRGKLANQLSLTSS
jgi:hypothetical protein